MESTWTAERYTASYVRQDKLNGRTVDVVQLVPAVPDLPFSLNVSVQPIVRHLTKSLAATGFNESARRAEPAQAG